VNPSEEFPTEMFDILLKVQTCDSSSNIKEECRLKIVESDLVEVFVSVGALEEIQGDFEAVNDVDKVFNLNEGRIIAHRIFILEYKDKWSHREGVDDQKSDAKVPDRAESTMTINKVPRQLGGTLDYLIFKILVFSLLVDDVASVQLLHFLFISGSLSQSAVVGSCEGPQILDTFLSWWLLFFLILKLPLSVSLLFRSWSEAYTTADDFRGLTRVILRPLFIFHDLCFDLLGIQVEFISFIPAFFGILVVVVIRWLTSRSLTSLRHLRGLLS